MSNEQQAQFEQMILTLSSADNVQRQQAEQSYNETKKNTPGFIVQALIEVGCNSQNVPAAQMALVLLRKNFSDLFDTIATFSEEEKNHIKSSLLNRFGDTNTPHGVRKACASAIANLAAKLSQDGRNAWPTLWELLLRTAGDEGAATGLRSMCLEVFSQVATVLVTTYFAPQLPALAEMLCKCLSHSDAGLRTKACETIAEFVHVCESAQMPILRQTAISMVNAFVASCRANDSDEALLQATQIRNIIDESDVTYFQDVYPPLLESCYNAAANQQLEGDVRHMAIGTIMSIGSTTKAVKNNSVFIKKIFELCFAYMLHPEMESDWEQTYEKEEDEEKTSDFDAGAQGCDRLAHIIKGKAMEQLAAPCIMQNIQSDNWKARGAALALLTYVFEGAAKAFLSHLDMIINQVVLPRINDPHPYVRYNAIQCVAQLSTDLCPAFQNKYGEATLPLIVGKLNDDCPRIMTLAACTVNTFFDELDNSKDDDEEEINKDPDTADEDKYESTKFCNPFLRPVCEALFTCLKGPKPVFVHSECLAALSSVIQLYEARIKPFTADIVACCQHYLSYGGDGNDATLIRCRAIECTTLTASYVLKQNFPAADDVCKYLLDLLASNLSQDDMRLRYVLRGWTCMVECLGPDVLKYLGQVMTPLLTIANSAVDAETLEQDIGDETEYKDTDEVKHVRIAVPGKGMKVLRMHTGLIEDKDLAVTILLNFTEELKGNMHPYLNDLTDMAIPLLKFQAMSETRESAAEMLKSLVNVVLNSDERNNIDQYVRHVTAPLMEAIDDEAEADTVQVMLGALGGILQKANPGVLPDELAREAARMMFEIYELAIKNVEDLQKEKDAERDEDEIEELEGAEQEQSDMLQDTATCIGQLLRIVPSFFTLFEEKFLPMTTSLLSPSLSTTQNQIGIHLLCEFIEHGGAPVGKHLPSAIETFKRFAQHNDENIVQASMYGLSMCVECAAKLPRNEQIAQFINSTVELIRNFLSHANAKDDDWLAVTINACSLGLRIIKHFGDTIDSKSLFQIMIEGHFPLSDDDEVEVERIHDLLAEWICNASHPLLGAQSPYRARILDHLRTSRYISEDARTAVKNQQ